ncbi:MAG: hypothetical protein Q4D37_10090 [Oscillospiraceae bacterium]|nr:hypothetical protein [Oscillospiraceae bacterium]
MNFKERYHQEMQSVKLEDSFRDTLSESMYAEQKKRKQCHRRNIIGSAVGICAAAAVLLVVPHIPLKSLQNNELLSSKETMDTTYYAKGELPFFSITTTFGNSDADKIASLSQLLQRWKEIERIVCYEISGVGTDCMLSEAEINTLYEQFQQAVPTEKTVQSAKKCHCYAISFQDGTILKFRVDKNNNVQFDDIAQAYHF